LGTQKSLELIVNQFGVSSVAEALDVHPAHLSNLSSRGVSPTLRRALVIKGVVPPKRKQYRRAALLGYGEKGEKWARAFDRYCAENNTSLSTIARNLAAKQFIKEANERENQ